MARRGRRGAGGQTPWIPPGVLPVWKPVGPTSHDLVDFVRRLLPRGVKVGHAGTLDPFAEGMLPLLVGGATRLADLVGQGEKTYRAVVDLSADTDTGDPTGAVIQGFEQPAGLDRARLEAVAAGLVGEQRQTPPAYSAVRVDGERAYARARRGEEVAMPERTVTIHELEVLDFAWPTLEFRVRCSRGTYVRSLGRDLGRALGAGGHLRALVREAVGRLGPELGRTPFELVALARIEDAYVPLEAALVDAARVEVGAEAAARLAHGSPVPVEQVRLDAGAPPGARDWIVYQEGEAFPLALAHQDGTGTVRPAKVIGRKG